MLLWEAAVDWTHLALGSSLQAQMLLEVQRVVVAKIQVD